MPTAHCPWSVGVGMNGWSSYIVPLLRYLSN